MRRGRHDHWLGACAAETPAERHSGGKPSRGLPGDSVLGDAAVLLWPDGAPGALGELDIDRPQVTVHLPPVAAATGAGVIVNPGGGYRILAADHEGLQVARWLNRRGIAAFVLRYRVGERYHSAVSLRDGLRAVRLVRHRAAEFGLAPDRLGMLGFSAGGHLAVAVGTQWDRGDGQAADPVERESSRPDFLVPVYAVTNGILRGRKADEYTPADVNVNADTPPTFLVHTHEDAIVPATQSTLFYDALLRAGVQAELHIYGYGEHGTGIAPGDPDFRAWPTLLLNWLRRSGFLTGAARCGVSGRVTLDGAAMGMAWITFEPLDENAPLARVRASKGDDGKFSIPPAHGVVPGPHRVTVHHVSERYPLSNDGSYTVHDVMRYDLGIVDVGDKPLVVDVAGADNGRAVAGLLVGRYIGNNYGSIYGGAAGAALGGAACS